MVCKRARASPDDAGDIEMYLALEQGRFRDGNAARPHAKPGIGTNRTRPDSDPRVVDRAKQASSKCFCRSSNPTFELKAISWQGLTQAVQRKQPDKGSLSALAR